MPKRYSLFWRPKNNNNSVPSPTTVQDVPGSPTSSAGDFLSVRADLSRGNPIFINYHHEPVQVDRLSSEATLAAQLKEALVTPLNLKSQVQENVLKQTLARHLHQGGLLFVAERACKKRALPDVVLAGERRVDIILSPEEKAIYFHEFNGYKQSLTFSEERFDPLQLKSSHGYIAQTNLVYKLSIGEDNQPSLKLVSLLSGCEIPALEHLFNESDLRAACTQDLAETFSADAFDAERSTSYTSLADLMRPS